MVAIIVIYKTTRHSAGMVLPLRHSPMKTAERSEGDDEGSRPEARTSCRQDQPPGVREDGDRQGRPAATDQAGRPRRETQVDRKGFETPGVREPAAPGECPGEAATVGPRPSTEGHGGPGGIS